jgi:hypothetical protein
MTFSIMRLNKIAVEHNDSQHNSTYNNYRFHYDQQHNNNWLQNLAHKAV